MVACKVSVYIGIKGKEGEDNTIKETLDMSGIATTRLITSYRLLTGSGELEIPNEK